MTTKTTAQRELEAHHNATWIRAGLGKEWTKTSAGHVRMDDSGRLHLHVQKNDRGSWAAFVSGTLIGTRNARGTAMRLCENEALRQHSVNAPTAAAVTQAESDERWWYDVDARAVKDENGLVVVHLEPSCSNTDGAKIAVAPHALSLVSCLSRLLNAIVSGDVGPAWKDRARELCREASDLIAYPGSSACIPKRKEN